MEGLTGRICVALALVASCGVLAACGDDDGEATSAADASKVEAETSSRPSFPELTTRDRIKIRYGRFLESFEDGRPAATCKSLAPSVARALVARGTSCKHEVAARLASGDYDDLEWPQAPLTGTRVAGRRAAGDISRPDDGGRLPIAFVRERGEWYVASVLDIGP